MGASINDLSPELIQMIVDHLDYCPRIVPFLLVGKPKLARYATISRYFQYAIESRLFYELKIDSDDSQELPTWTPSRVAAVRSLQYKISVPPFPANEQADSEAKDEKKRKRMGREGKALDLKPDQDPKNILHRNKHFTNGLRECSKFLQMLESTAAPPIHLDISTRCPRGHVSHRFQNLETDALWEELHIGCDEIIFGNSHLALLGDEEYPKSNRVHELELLSCMSIYAMDGKSIFKIISLFPKLERLWGEFNEGPYLLHKARQERRYCLAQAMKNASIPSSLKFFRFNVSSYGPHNERFSPPSSLLKTSPLDHLSLAYNSVSQSMVHLRISESSVLSPSLFWPSNPDDPKPYWPHLKTVLVIFSPVTPEGKWRYEGHTDSSRRPRNLKPRVDTSDSEESVYGDEDNMAWLDDGSKAFGALKKFSVKSGNYPTQLFRRVAVPERITPMFAAAARAAGQMPSLQTMDIRSCLTETSIACNRMLFVEKWADIKGLELVEAQRETLNREGLGEKPLVYWLTKHYDPSEVNKIWRETKNKGGDLEFRRIFRRHHRVFPDGTYLESEEEEEDEEDEEEESWITADIVEAESSFLAPPSWAMLGPGPDGNEWLAQLIPDLDTEEEEEEEEGEAEDDYYDC